MRITSLLLVCTSGFALSACAVSDSAYQLDNSLSTCSFNCAPKPPKPTPVVTTPTTPVSTVNTGNTAVIAADTGNATIALEASRVVLPSAKVRTLLEVSATGDTAKMNVDTKTATNSNWPKSKAMNEYVFGTTAAGGVGLGGAYKEYRIVQAGDLGQNTVDEELQVWTWGNSIAAQYRDMTGGGGEARNQAWSFGGTKTTAAQIETAKAAAAGADVTFNGRFGATAKTSGFKDPNFGVDLSDASLFNDDVQYLSHNGLYRLEGSTQLTANFTTGAFAGTLTPEFWIGYANMNGADGELRVNANDVFSQNHAIYMDDNVVLKGTIATSATSAATDNSAAAHNSITGTAELDITKGWVNYDGLSPMYAAFFGPNADEVTGAFNFEAMGPTPIGGTPINNDRRSFVQMSGVFHAE